VERDTHPHELGTTASGELAKDGPLDTIDAGFGTGASQSGARAVGPHPAADGGASRHDCRDGRDEVDTDLVALIDDERSIVREASLAVVDSAFNKRRRVGTLAATGLHPGGG
jgi:hypothetical protein